MVGVGVVVNSKIVKMDNLLRKETNLLVRVEMKKI